MAEAFTRAAVNFAKHGHPSGTPVEAAGEDEEVPGTTLIIDRDGAVSSSSSSRGEGQGEASPAAKARTEFWLEATARLRTGMLRPEELSKAPVATIHETTAEKRGLVTDPNQLLS